MRGDGVARLLGRWGFLLAGVLAGVLAGAVTAVAEVCLLCAVGAAAALTAPWPRARRTVSGWFSAATGRLVAVERARLSVLLGRDVVVERSGREAGYFALRAPLGLVGGYVSLTLLFVAALLFAGSLWDLVTGRSETLTLALPGVYLNQASWMVGAAYGVGALVLATLWSVAVATGERRIFGWFMGPDARELMERRIVELTATRAGVLRAIDDERRRIERDLHDGVQQRVVALAMLLGRARRGTDPGRTLDLVGQAHAESRQLLDELRDVAWRVYPTALDDLGLEAALAGVAERAPVSVSVHYGLSRRPAPEVETALYFVAREAITNAAKHAGARDVTVVLSEDPDERGRRGGTVAVRVSDDGRGGADAAGGGLSGLARRVAALDGRFDVRSPRGGPTTVTAILPDLRQHPIRRMPT
ncbi:signal transduction histidine kinase [Actinorugispora endophytica]|uniref:histidine kinase n=1 Tax=Actinorugispora endophytica TaxID=1605990 RepID=A0A4R6UZL8_9ACTN|nr:signal transduction histidine kinase [Actinorugispora endophytica]